VLTSGAADPPRAGRPHGWIGGGQPSSRLAAALDLSLSPSVSVCRPAAGVGMAGEVCTALQWS
jgi:hypothetical protein